MISLDIHKKLLGTSGKMALDISLDIPTGSLLTLYGSSGVGKTSLLKMLAGLMEPDMGKISVGEEIWFDVEKRINLAPQRRDVGFVFQDYALFPNMTIRENLSFALEKGQSQAIVEELIELVELGELRHRKPATLSGGQQQRVALARALVRKPKVLMLDEPLSALDNVIRRKLQDYILQVHREFKLTTLLVSHEVSEIFRMSDLTIVLENGRIAKRGAPAAVFSHQEVSGKFQFVGEVIKIDHQDFIYIVSVLIGNELIRMVAEESEILNIDVGDKVIVASKAFNPIIKKLE